MNVGYIRKGVLTRDGRRLRRQAHEMLLYFGVETCADVSNICVDDLIILLHELSKASKV